MENPNNAKKANAEALDIDNETIAQISESHTSKAAASSERFKRINFEAINRAAIAALPAIVFRWLPDGEQEGDEWVCLNPRRDDHNLGSFKVNLHTGMWADFATGDTGGDPVSLAAYLHDLSQVEAAKQLAKMLGVSYDQ